MTSKNARTEARGILVQFAGGAPEFQREITFGTHGGRAPEGVVAVAGDRTRLRLELGRGGEGSGEFSKANWGMVCDRRGHGRGGRRWDSGNFLIGRYN